MAKIAADWYSDIAQRKLAHEGVRCIGNLRETGRVSVRICDRPGPKDRAYVLCTRAKFRGSQSVPEQSPEQILTQIQKMVVRSKEQK